MTTQQQTIQSVVNIERYQDSQKSNWDNFVRNSKNGTFLFLRDYMDYHRDRMHDHSLIIRDERQNIIALLPANKRGNSFLSHEGLTYGGFVTDANMKVPKMLNIFDATFNYLRQRSFTKFVYKTIPYIYHKISAEEDRYALFLCEASLTRRGVLAVVDCQSKLPFQERRRRMVKKATTNNLIIKECDDFEAYWVLLTQRLREAYETQPVHSLEEITSLKSRLPGNIKLFACFSNANILAGVVIYESERVAHVQYIASNKQGKELGALDLIFHSLLSEVYRQKSFFDFGTSDEHNGRYLNKGLIDQKEGFGARAVVHDHYTIDLTRWHGQMATVME
jgi:hypothetical protein